MLRTWREIFSRLTRGRIKQGIDHDTTIVLTQYHIKPALQEKWMEVLHEHTLSSLRATGVIMAEAYYENGDPSVMWTIERWRNRKFYHDHKKMKASRVVDALIKYGLIAPLEISFLKHLEQFSAETSGNTSRANSGEVTIMLRIEVNTGKENDFIIINHELVLNLRNEPGLLLFQFSQLLSYPSRFIVWKKFRNWDAFQDHLKDSALTPVLTFLQTAVKDPPFEKAYRHLIQFAPFV